MMHRWFFDDGPRRQFVLAIFQTYWWCSFSISGNKMILDYFSLGLSGFEFWMIVLLHLTILTYYLGFLLSI